MCVCVAAFAGSVGAAVASFFGLASQQALKRFGGLWIANLFYWCLGFAATAARPTTRNHHSTRCVTETKQQEPQ